MRNCVGEPVILTIGGKVAEKKSDGKLTGKMIAFKEGDLGIVVGNKGKVGGRQVYSVCIPGGVITLNDRAVDFPENNELKISHEAMLRAHPDYRVKEEDKKTGAEY